MDTCTPGSGSKAQPLQSAVLSLAEENPAQELNENLGEAQEVASQGAGLDNSVADTLMNSQAAAADPRVHPTQQDEHQRPEMKVPDEVCADEQLLSVVSAHAALADSGARAVDGTLVNTTIFPTRKMTRAQARAAQASSVAPESPACKPPGAHTAGSDLTSGCGESGLADEGAAPQGSAASVPATCDNTGETSSRRTRSSRRTVAAQVIEAESAPVTIRRTRAQGSISTASKPAAPPSPVHVPRKPRSRKGRAQDGDSVLSGDSAAASEGPAPRRRTRANSAATLDRASVDSEDVADCENQATENLATSKPRQAEESDHYKSKFVPLSPILEDVPESKNGVQPWSLLQIWISQNEVLT